MLDGAVSDKVDVLSGVPQGMVLRPIVFLCFINNIADNLRSNIRLFAYNTLLYRTMENQSDVQALQQDLSQSELWAKTWQMEFNFKCFVLHIISK